MGAPGKKRSHHLSKNLFIKGLQCHKYLWLEKYRPELKDELKHFQQAVFASGTDVGARACGLFPGGIAIPYDGLSYAGQLARTAQAMADGAPTVYEASFSHDGIFVKADILHKTAQGWHLYEVKSSTEMKEVYLNDVALQYHVLNGAGVSLSGASLVHINNQYVRRGALDVHELFTIQDISAPVIERQPFIQQQAAAMRAMLQSDMPCIDIGPHCKDPYDCQFMGTCWKHVPEPSVLSLRGRGVDTFALYRQGIVRMEDVPINILPRDQLLQVEGTLHKKDRIDTAAIQAFLGTLRYPLCFLDFETTCMTPVPLYDGTRPYQAVPFQFSAHVTERAGAQMRHHEYLASAAGTDPRVVFMKALLDAVPPDACIVVYNQSFEKRILGYLREWFPEYTDRIDAMIEGMVDLMEPFRNKDVYLWQMKGSYSIKEVLPALVPELSYDVLSISNGEMASSAWLALAQESDPEKVETVRKQLREYCGLDTLAMVRILERLKELAA